MLDNTRNRGFQENLSEPGSASITFQNDDPDLASMVPPNTLINFYADGVLAFTMLAETFDAILLDQGEEANEATVWAGRGHLALFERALVYPSIGVGRRPIEADRAFNWTAIAYDDSAWIAATSICTVFHAKFNPPGDGAWDGGVPEVQWDPTFPDNTALIIWASDGTVSGAGLGDCYFRQTITIPADGNYTLFALIDNYGEVYVDGQLVMSPGQSQALEVGFKTTSKITLEFSAGSHLIAVKGTNAVGTGSNPAGIAWAIFPSDALGNIGSVLDHSSTSSKIVEYATQPPGMTPGKALLLAIIEAQTRAAGDALAFINLLTVSFDAVHDSAGNPWPVVADIATKVGTTLLQFLRELSGTYIDFYMAPGTLTLDCWMLGGRGTTPGVDYHSPTNPNDANTGNLLHHGEKGEA